MLSFVCEHVLSPADTLTKARSETKTEVPDHDCGGADLEEIKTESNYFQRLLKIYFQNSYEVNSAALSTLGTANFRDEVTIK